MRIALAQLNVVVGDLDGNVGRIAAAIEEAKRAAADLVVFPELAVTGYPPEDLLLRPGFVRAAREAVDEVARELRGDRRARRRAGVRPRPRERRVRVRGRRRAGRLPQALPPELRRLRRAPLLRPRPRAPAAPARRRRWSARRSARTSGSPARPATDLALAGATLLVNLSASPYHGGKAEDREEMLVTRARDNAAYIAFCNLVGGQDELVFDGHSVVLDDEGEVVARAPGFEEALLVVDVDPTEAIGRRLRDVRRRELERSRAALARRDDARAARAARGRGARRGDRDAVRLGARAAAPRARARPARLRREERLPATSSSRSRAASTRRSRRRSPPTRSGPSASTPSRCRRASRRTRPATTHAT